MSAIAANVFSGLIKAITPATSNSTAKSHMTSRSQPPASDSEHELLEAGQDEHDPDQHADGRDRGLVELQDHEGDHDPGDPGYQPEPPEAAERDSGLVECDGSAWYGDASSATTKNRRSGGGPRARRELSRQRRRDHQQGAYAGERAGQAERLGEQPDHGRPGEQPGVADARHRGNRGAGDRGVVAGRPHASGKTAASPTPITAKPGDRAGGRGPSSSAVPRPAAAISAPALPSLDRPDAAPPLRRPTAARSPSRG